MIFYSNRATEVAAPVTSRFWGVDFSRFITQCLLFYSNRATEVAAPVTSRLWGVDFSRFIKQSIMCYLVYQTSNKADLQLMFKFNLP